MGLAERRLVAAAQEQEFKPFAEKIKGILGYDVALDFDWGAIENHSNINHVCESKKITSNCFDKITEAFTKICADDMGKTAVREKLKGIKMIPTSGDMEFANGLFTIRTCVDGNGVWGADQIQSELEKHL